MEMTRGSVPNFLSNSQEFARKFGERIVGAVKDVQAPKKLIDDISKTISVNMSSIVASQAQLYSTRYSSISIVASDPSLCAVMSTSCFLFDAISTKDACITPFS